MKTLKIFMFPAQMFSIRASDPKRSDISANVFTLSEIRRQRQKKESKGLGLTQLIVTGPTKRGVGCDSLGSTLCGETRSTINVAAPIIN
jgi:hypothetical protein